MGLSHRIRCQKSRGRRVSTDSDSTVQQYLLQWALARPRVDKPAEVPKQQWPEQGLRRWHMDHSDEGQRIRPCRMAAGLTRRRHGWPRQ